jgi:hypothetical protein
MDPSPHRTVDQAPGQFDSDAHFYPKVLNAQIHPMVRYFLSLGNDRIIERYCHLHPEVQPLAVREALLSRTRHFRWGGADLFHVTDERGLRQMMVVETNSCPSGQKSMPRYTEDDEQAGYRLLLDRSFMPMLRRRALPTGGLAVLWDKNLMETSGYAAALADLAGETVHLVPFFDGDPDPSARFVDGLLEIRDAQGVWRPIRAAFRYVTQRPWNRIPPVTRTAIFNPVLSCLAGGRNKMLAAKAYDLFNAELSRTGLQIRTPETIWDVSKNEVPLWVQRMGGVAVIKDPYSNAGQGVFTIASQRELDAFMAGEYRYGRFIVQALIGNSGWSSRGREGRIYHVGTVPNTKAQIHVADVRFMVGSSPDGFYPVAIYARRARRAMTNDFSGEVSSWDQLGTNLSVRSADGGWSTESERLMLMDSRDFNRLGLGLDELIEGYVQTTLAVTAIDRMSDNLLTQKGVFRRKLFASLNPDATLVEEIV